MPTPVSRSGS
ncbi:hypothetical protein LEMLEM_LOCUS920 [Lemmus lemmus]